MSKTPTEVTDLLNMGVTDVSDTMVHHVSSQSTLDLGRKNPLDFNDNSKIVMAADKVKKIVPVPRFNNSVQADIAKMRKTNQQPQKLAA